MPELGLKSIRLSQNSDSDFALAVEASRELSLAQPQISANGKELIVSFSGLAVTAQASTSAQLDLRRPGRVAQPSYVPPLRSRATAPPVGDIAVGTMLVSPNNFINISGPPVSLVLNNAPAKDALMSLARIGGFSFVFVNSEASAQTEQAAEPSRLVSLAFKNESYSRALNSVLLSSGLQAKLEGRTLLVGKDLSQSSFAPQMSKVFRLNQVKADKASNYLANLGSCMNTTNTITTTTGAPAAIGTSQLSTETSQTTSEEFKVEKYCAEQGPLRGLVGTTDERLGTVTLIGEPKLINIAESYLKQLDLRRRQVAVKVQILNVNLNNDKTIDSSFSARMGDTFIVSESGKGFFNFGDYKPGGPSGGGRYGDGASGVPGTYPRIGDVAQQRVIDPVVEQQRVFDPVVAPRSVLGDYRVAQERVYDPITGDISFRDLIIDGEQVFLTPDEVTPLIDRTGQDVYVPSSDPSAEQILRPVYDSDGRLKYVPSNDPTAEQVLRPVYDKDGRLKYVPDSNQYRQPDNSFYAYLEAQIQTRNTRIIAQPTLLVQEGQQSSVVTGEKVITNVEESQSSTGGSNTFTFEKETAGLTMGVSVDKIDDNGFVTLSLNPTVSVPVPAGQQSGVPIFNINERTLTSGDIRLRDGQTLVLTGVINEQQRELVSKWPILGDLPFLGSLFRSTSSARTKDELVILVTPRILDDNQGGTYGYGYRPGTSEGTRFLRDAS